MDIFNRPLFDSIGNGSNGSFASPDIASDRDLNQATIFGKVKSQNILQYPLFLGNSSAAKGNRGMEAVQECIRFTAVKQPGVSFQGDFVEKDRKNRAERDLSTNGGGNFDFIKEVAGSFDGSAPVNARIQNEVAVRTQTQQSSGQRNTTVEEQEAAERQSLLGQLADRAGDITRNLRVQKSEELQDCFLYMPPSVIFNEGAAWQKEELGFTGNAIKDAVTGGRSIDQILSNFGVGAAPGIATAAAVGGSAAISGFLGLGALVGALAPILGGGGAVSGLKSASRLQQNPYEEQLFQGVDFRVFSFQFDFAATDDKEYEMVKNIIKMFRLNSRPGFIGNNGDAGINAVYTYPNEFAIQFLRLNEDQSQYELNDNLPKIHNCVLTNITTNYAPDGWQAHSRGEPNLISVQLAFTETRKNTRTDIENNF